MSRTLSVDIETRSRVDLKKSNVYRYVEDPDFRILMMGYAWDDGPVRMVQDQDEAVEIIREALSQSDTLIEAHNAAFERICFSAAMGLPVGQYLHPNRFTDVMIDAAEAGYPRKLEHLAKAVGAEEKDSAGTLLINFFSKPNRKGEFNKPEDHPEKWQMFLDYCGQDVETMIDARRRLGKYTLTEVERQAWIVDQLVNDAGIPVDTDLAGAAIDQGELNRLEQVEDFQILTGVDNPGSNVQVMRWFAETGHPLPNLQAKTVEAQLVKPDLAPVHRHVLTLRQELALVAAKKYQAALDRVNVDGRLRGAFQFFGAHTGRWAGRGVQLQNLPRASIKPAEGQSDDAAIQEAVDALLAGQGANAHTLKALVRPMFTGPFTVCDYSAIEARVLAWLAGEEWVLEAFRAGRDIYVETASRLGPQYTRQDGKVAALALGYGSGIAGLRAMGGQGSDEALQAIVTKWRAASPETVSFWYELESAFKSGGQVREHITVEKDGRDRLVWLPSGRAIIYRDVRGRMVQKWGKVVREIHFADPSGPGFRTATYSGKLAENLTQAVARDILAAATVRVHEAGYQIVGHVHDELIVLGEHPVGELAAVMTQDPGWAEGLPLNAEGYNCPRYRKQ